MSWRGELAVSAADSELFARLSGDYNPLHLDPVAARRMPFGGTVVHGIHLLLKALDSSAEAWSRTNRAPSGLSVVFSNPLRTGETLAISAGVEADGGRLRLMGEVHRRTVFSASVDLRAVDPPVDSVLPDREFPRQAPAAVSFPPAVTAGSVPLALSRACLEQLLPGLAAGTMRGWIADLLATTRIVGMHCPGMDSVYSACKLQAQPSPVAPVADSMRYEVVRADERFRMIRVRVAGVASQGHIEALFRAPPVHQLSLSRVAAAVPAGVFAGQRALVIGGSRGLGELTAKIIAAGSGEVIITYARGREDAERVCTEARDLAFNCTARHLDLAAVSEPDDVPAWVAASARTHAYYFASPPITKNASASFDQTLYRQFTRIYVEAFAALARQLLGTAPSAHAPRARLRFFYPSTVFLDGPAPGFAEYCAAKAEAERMCAELAQQYGATVLCPRLPRMRTDQTSGVREADVQDSLPVLLGLLRRFHP